MPKKVQKKINKLMDFIHEYTLEMIILGFCSLAFCWVIGYFSNAILDMKFDLQSCWAGFSAIGGAGVLAAIKYCMDSWKNTPEGEAPDYSKDKSTIMKDMAKIGSEILKEYAKQEEGRKGTNDRTNKEII